MPAKKPERRRINHQELAARASALWWISFTYGEGYYSLLPWVKITPELKVSQAFRARIARQALIRGVTC